MASSEQVKTINQTHFGIRAHADLHAESELRSLWIEIPDYCQLQCKYCFANTVMNHPHKTRGFMQLGEYLKLLDDFHAQGGKFLGIPGNGEPFHPGNRELVLAILKHATRLGISTTIFTTGEAIFFEMSSGDYAACTQAAPDFQLMEEMKDLDVIFLVKCNSLKPDVQDALVKQPGYAEARARAMDWLMNRYHLNTQGRLGIVTSIMDENKDEILDLYEYARKYNLVFDCDTILPRGRGRHFTEHGSLRHGDYRAIYKKLDEASCGKLSSGGSYVGVACDRVKHHLYVDIKGDVFPCIGCVGRKESLALGNIRKRTLAEIWNDSRRVLLREHLGEIVVGPCSCCQNFQKTCWSCLGRAVERFEVSGDHLILHTRGCFNHKPDWEKWALELERRVRSMISEVPDGLRARILDALKEFGTESFWRKNPPALGGGVTSGAPVGSSFPPVKKDFTSKDFEVPGKTLWDVLCDDPLTDVPDGEAVDIHAYGDHYGDSLMRLLPSKVLPSLAIIFKKYDTPFVPSPEGLTQSAFGRIQFCNLMFYMPFKRRYFYRTISRNSLDANTLVLPEHDTFCKAHPEAAQRMARDLLIRNRKVTIMQRWAEAFRDHVPAPILPYIQNLSDVLEEYTYELILTEKLHNETAFDHDHEIRFHGRNILSIFPLIASDTVRKRAGMLDELLNDIVTREDEWKATCGAMSEEVFAYSAAGTFEKLESLYDRMARVAFVTPDTLGPDEVTALTEGVIKSLRGVLAHNLVLFPHDSESSWFGGDVESCLARMNWSEFFELLAGHGPDRRVNRKALRLPRCLSQDRKVDTHVLVARLYNPILIQFAELFVGMDGRVAKNWARALNYFIWLGYLRHHLDVESYFVLHSPNLQQQSRAFVGQDVERTAPSGMIISSQGRLSLRARDQCGLLFRAIMEPLEELANAQAAREAGEREGRQEMAVVLHSVLRHDIRGLETSIGSIVNNVLDFWQTLDQDAMKKAFTEVRSLARLAAMSTGLDFLWQSGKSVRDEMDSLSELRDCLREATQFAKHPVVFDGQWNDSQVMHVRVPRALRIVISNLIRNARAPSQNRGKPIQLTFAMRHDRAEFSCRSHVAMSRVWVHRRFEVPFDRTEQVPKEHRGLWICRYIIEGLCGGRWYLGECDAECGTNICFDIPIE